MKNEQIIQALETLKAIQTDNPDVQQALMVLGDAISAGNIIDSTGVAIGRNIRMIVNQVNLPAEMVAALLDMRAALGGLTNDKIRYPLRTLLEEGAREFVGRDHVFKAIDEFVDNYPNGYFTIEGDPGIGKSAILAEYARRKCCIIHFNNHSMGVTKAQQFLESIRAQIITDLGFLHEDLSSEENYGLFLLQLLEKASSGLKPGEKLIIAVDALDEVDLASHSEGANILYLPPKLPKGVYFIMSRQRVKIPLVAQAPQEVLDMMIYQTENRDDIENHINRRINSELQKWIDRQNLTANAFVYRLADLSENNFMYLFYVLPAIETGKYHGLNIEDLPLGLKGYYEDHWRLMDMTAKPLPRVKIRIVYILCEVGKPVSLRLITDFANDKNLPVDELMVQEVLNDWDRFLRRQPMPDGTRYSMYHTSFRNFLHRKDIVQQAGVTIPGIHVLIANTLWNALVDEA